MCKNHQISILFTLVRAQEEERSDKELHESVALFFGKNPIGREVYPELACTEQGRSVEGSPSLPAFGGRRSDEVE
jgi:hypothetical protein